MNLLERTKLKVELIEAINTVKHPTADVCDVLFEIIADMTPKKKGSNGTAKKAGYRSKTDDPWYDHRLVAHRIRTDLVQAGQNGIEVKAWKKYISPADFKKVTVAELMDAHDNLRDRMGKARYDRERYAQ